MRPARYAYTKGVFMCRVGIMALHWCEHSLIIGSFHLNQRERKRERSRGRKRREIGRERDKAQYKSWGVWTRKVSSVERLRIKYCSTSLSMGWQLWWPPMASRTHLCHHGSQTDSWVLHPHLWMRSCRPVCGRLWWKGRCWAQQNSEQVCVRWPLTLAINGSFQRTRSPPFGSSVSMDDTPGVLRYWLKPNVHVFSSPPACVIRETFSMLSLGC